MLCQFEGCGHERDFWRHDKGYADAPEYHAFVAASPAADEDWNEIVSRSLGSPVPESTGAQETVTFPVHRFMGMINGTPTDWSGWYPCAEDGDCEDYEEHAVATVAVATITRRKA